MTDQNTFIDSQAGDEPEAETGEGPQTDPARQVDAESSDLGSVSAPLMIKLALPAFGGGILMFILDPPMVWRGIALIAVGFVVLTLAIRAIRRGE